MVTWHRVGTKSARGSMWFMHRCFRLRGMKSSSWTCVEHAGLLDSAQVSRHSRDCMQAAPPLCMQQSVDATIVPSRRAFVEGCGSGCNQGHCQGVRCMAYMQNVLADTATLKACQHAGSLLQWAAA